MNLPLNVPHPEEDPSAGGFELLDVLYALFRHKWKVLFLSLVGLGVAAALYKWLPTSYVSSANLFIKYIVETRAAEAMGPDGRVSTPSSTAETIINSEIEIIDSLDLCRKVAEKIGADRVLGTPGESTNSLSQAAMVLFRGLTVDGQRNSSVIKIKLSHRDPAVAQTALIYLIEVYLQKHVEVHRGGAGNVDVFLSQQVDQSRARLVQTEDELRKLKAKAGITSVEDSRKAFAAQIASIRQMILAAEAELAEYKNVSSNDVTRTVTAGTNAAVTPVSAETPPAPAALAEYKALVARLEVLHEEEMQKRAVFTESNRTVLRVRELITEAESRKKALEKESPTLLQLNQAAMISRSPLSPGLPVPSLDPSRGRSLETKLQFLTGQLEKARQEASSLEEVDASISQLQRKKELEEKNYKYFAAGLEQAQFDEEISARKHDNIVPVQTPTPSKMEAGKRLKLVAMAGVGGIAAGVALALLLELFVDRSVRRFSHIETKLRLPLFFSVPRLRLSNEAPASPMNGSAAPDQAGAMALPGWAPDHPFRRTIDEMRDRTLIHFDGVPHKPKLIGFCGCRTGAGVTTVAAALAASLSETADGRVLFVNLSSSERGLTQFFRGSPSSLLDDGGDSGKLEGDSVGDNLYLATVRAISQGGRSDSLPMSMAKMLPKIKASDYDYVIFDMPAISRTGVTARVSSMLDLVLVVVESERDSQDTVKRAAELLRDSKVRFSIVLNKFREYLPATFHKGL